MILGNIAYVFIEDHPRTRVPFSLSLSLTHTLPKQLELENFKQKLRQTITMGSKTHTCRITLLLRTAERQACVGSESAKALSHTHSLCPVPPWPFIPPVPFLLLFRIK